MGRWLSQIAKFPGREPTKPTKPSSVSFVGTDSKRIQFVKTSAHPHVMNKNFTTENLQEKGSVSFVGEAPNAFSLLEKFYDMAAHLKLELLPDDKRWLQKICWCVLTSKLKPLLDQYAIRWVDAMKNEQLLHKKQNVGRYSANTFLRESLRK